MDLSARLRRLEGMHKAQGKRVHIIKVGKGLDVENEEQLEHELMKPKYENATVIIDNIPKPQQHPEEQGE